MAVCSWCHAEMRGASTCTVDALHREGRRVELAPFRDRKKSARCGSCGVAVGGWHHPGCDLQRCPLCRGQMCSCDCLFDEDEVDEDEIDEDLEPYGVDGNGAPTAIKRIGDVEVIYHYVEVLACDVAEVDGIPVTTPLRTVIDLAPDITRERLTAVVHDCLSRRLFSLDEAWHRLAQPDMREYRGAALLRQVLAEQG